MAWTHNNNPPGGPGHGGPARGAGTGGPAVPFSADSVRGDAKIDNLDADEQAYRQERRAESRERRRLKEERTVELEDRLYQVGMGLVADATAVQIQAARSVHAIWNGMPTQKTELTGADGDAVKIEAIRRVIVDPRNPDT
jgi:hypothetical protein